MLLLAILNQIKTSIMAQKFTNFIFTHDIQLLTKFQPWLYFNFFKIYKKLGSGIKLWHGSKPQWYWSSMVSYECEYQLKDFLKQLKLLTD